MRKLTVFFALFTIVLLQACGDATEPTDTKASEELQGTWVMSAIESSELSGTVYFGSITFNESTFEWQLLTCKMSGALSVSGNTINMEMESLIGDGCPFTEGTIAQSNYVITGNQITLTDNESDDEMIFRKDFDFSEGVNLSVNTEIPAYLVSGKKMWFKVTVQDGQSYSIDGAAVNLTGGALVVVSAYQDDKTTAYFEEDNDVLNAIGSQTIETVGTTLYILVEGYSSAQSGRFNLIVTGEATPLSSDASNTSSTEGGSSSITTSSGTQSSSSNTSASSSDNTPTAQENILEEGVWKTATMDYTTMDSTWFVIKATAGQQIQILVDQDTSFESGSGDYNAMVSFKIYLEDGTTVFTNTTFGSYDEPLTFTVPSSDSLLVKVNPGTVMDLAEGTYAIQYRLHENSLTAGDSVVAKIYPNDSLWYEISANTSDSLIVEILNESNSNYDYSLIGSTMEIFMSDKSTKYSESDIKRKTDGTWGGYGDNDYFTAKFIPTENTVWVLLTTGSSDGGSYKLQTALVLMPGSSSSSDLSSSSVLSSSVSSSSTTTSSTTISSSSEGISSSATTSSSSESVLDNPVATAGGATSETAVAISSETFYEVAEATEQYFSMPVVAGATYYVYVRDFFTNSSLLPDNNYGGDIYLSAIDTDGTTLLINNEDFYTISEKSFTATTTGDILLSISNGIGDGSWAFYITTTQL